jgi:trimethylamine-N-oxide reductase (cytochrome c)
VAHTRSCLAPLGAGYRKRVYSPNRVFYPLKRVDWEPGGDPAKINAQNRGISKYKRISWEEALDTISSEMRRLADTYGPACISAMCNPHGELKNIHADANITHAFLHYWSQKQYGEHFTEVMRSPYSWEGTAWGAKHVNGIEMFGEESDSNLWNDISANCELMLYWGCDNMTKAWCKQDD